MALRRVIKTRSPGSGLVRYRIGPSKLYLDDLQMIHDSLLSAGEQRAVDSGSGDAIGVEIKAGDALADKIDDLRDARPDELARVRLSLGDPSVTVDLRREFADVSGTSNDPVSQELAAGIRDHINARRSAFYGLGMLAPLYLLPLGVALLSIPAIYHARAHPLGTVLALVGVTLGLVALAVIANYVLARRFGSIVVVPRKESEARGLKRETRNTIIIAVISSAIIGLAGFWAGVFVRH